MVKTDVPTTLDPRLALSAEFVATVRRHVDGVASGADLKILQANERLWIRALYRLLDDIAESIDNVRVAIRGYQRARVVKDLESEYRAVDTVLTSLVGPPYSLSNGRKKKIASSTLANKTESPLDGVASKTAPSTRLQLSWMPGRVIAWAAKPGGHFESSRDILERLNETGASTIDWQEYRQVKLKDGSRADSVSTDLGSCLGWLVALGKTTANNNLGASVSWLGLVTALAVRLTAQGRVVPQLKKLRRLPSRSASSSKNNNTRVRSRESLGSSPDSTGKSCDTRNHMVKAGFAVRWMPILMESSKLEALSESLPGAVAAFENQRGALAFTQAVLSDILNAIITQAVSRIDMAAPPPVLRTRADVAEKTLIQLDGEPFEGPLRFATDLGKRLDKWHRPVRDYHDHPVIIRLNPPEPASTLTLPVTTTDSLKGVDSSYLKGVDKLTDSWQLSVLSKSSDGYLQPVEQALTIASQERKLSVKHQLVRLERLCPDLIRLGGRRRGEVSLSPDEAWRLMTETKPVLEACGYESHFPDLSHHRPTTALRITALDDADSAVGAEQLANVRWSVVIDDVELSVEDIRRLAQDSRPLVKSRGCWVELDRKDLSATVQALEDRAATTHMSGSDMLRHAIGLEKSPLQGPTTITGHGWAVDLIRSANEIPSELPVKPEGFKGRLRNYQAESLVWLQFLKQAGLGGCLALDMGLGKTPVLLAHIQLTRDIGPSLVVAPPAVIGNWQSEAHRFVPELRVVIHHGPGRWSAETMPDMVEQVDLVITTYGTAVRDIDSLERISWSTIVADEAQAIKNHNSETARQLRRLSGKNRITLTGTPIENGLGDLWSIINFCNPGLLGSRSYFVAAMSSVTASEDSSVISGISATENDTRHGNISDLSRNNTQNNTPLQDGFGANFTKNGQLKQKSLGPTERDDRKTTTQSVNDASGEDALAALNGLLIFRRTKAEPLIAAELPDRIDEVDHCTMTREQVGLYQAVLDQLALDTAESDNTTHKKGFVLAAITALKQICNHPVNYRDDSKGIAGRSGKLVRLEEIMDKVFLAQEKVLIFTHFASWGERLALYLSEQTGIPIACYHGGLSRGARDRMIAEFQNKKGASALVLSLKAGGTGLNLTAANHVVLYDRWWNPAVEDQARDRAWRIGQRNTVICHRLVCPGTVDERVEEIVAGKRHIANMVLPKSSSIGDLDSQQLQVALGINLDHLLIDDSDNDYSDPDRASSQGDPDQVPSQTSCITTKI